MSSTNLENQRKLLIVAGIIIALLVGTIIFLVVNKYNQTAVIEEQKIELAEAQKLNDELQEEYDNAIAELDEALAENEGLRDMIEEQKSALLKEKNSISKLISSGKADKNALAEARKQISELRAQQEQFIAKIDQLERENADLTAEKTQLEEEKKLVEEEVIREREEKTVVIAEKEAIEEEKKDLEEIKAVLEEKVDIASVVKVRDVGVTGYKLRSSGKMVKKRYAKNIDVLKICYSADDNRIAEPGTETFLVRLISPLGTTVYVEPLGSGTFVNKDLEEEIRFTKSQEVPYDGESVDKCMNWKPDTPFAKGTYIVEIFNKGY